MNPTSVSRPHGRLARTRLAALAVTAAAALALTACAGSSEAAPSDTAAGASAEDLELNVQYSVFNGPLNRAAAVDLQPEGLTVNYIDGAGIDVGQGLTTGAFDVAQWGEVGPVTSYYNGGTDIRVIGTTDANGGAHTILVGPDNDAQTIADLEGGTTVFSRSTNSYIQFLTAIEEAGLQEDDFTIIESVPDATAALLSGQVDFIISIEPVSSSLVETKGLRELTNGEGRVDNHYPLITNQAVLDDPDKSAALEIYLAALREHFEWADASEANAQKEAEAVAALNGVSLEVAVAAGEKVSNEWIPIDSAFVEKERALVDFFVQSGAFESFPDGFEEIYDDRFNAILVG
ncbi:ABC transporter substrate-binding protein [Microbacterium sp. 18062]|uniref:ABC transporter substrate-binding protein n=1 Tax=Microbacterium sp. 18062 TaxID=2681410 RepID=UPI00135B1098|nr:ABC transporter substrate-binding protein [Microbacterium sp. 18062]